MVFKDCVRRRYWPWCLMSAFLQIILSARSQGTKDEIFVRLLPHVLSCCCLLDCLSGCWKKHTETREILSIYWLTLRHVDSTEQLIRCLLSAYKVEPKLHILECMQVVASVSVSNTIYGATSSEQENSLKLQLLPRVWCSPSHNFQILIWLFTHLWYCILAVHSEAFWVFTWLWLRQDRLVDASVWTCRREAVSPGLVIRNDKWS